MNILFFKVDLYVDIFGVDGMKRLNKDDIRKLQALKKRFVDFRAYQKLAKDYPLMKELLNKNKGAE